MVGKIIQTTAAVPALERWDYWKETTLAAVDAVPVGNPSTFTASRSIVQTAPGTLIDSVSNPMSLKRPRARIARDGLDHACLVVALTGSGVIDQQGRAEGVVVPGDMMLYDLARPYTAASLSDYHELRLYFPRETFATRVGRIEDLSGLKISGDGELAKLFVGYLKGYAQALSALPVQDADIGMEGVLHLLAALVRSALKTDGAGEAPAGNTLLAMADRHIQALLADTSLEVAALARALGVSRTRLYEAFAERGGVAASIRNARLDRAGLRLREPADRPRTMEEIARGCGFADYPTFVRAFRRRFGVPPGAWRAS